MSIIAYGAEAIRLARIHGMRPSKHVGDGRYQECSIRDAERALLRSKCTYGAGSLGLGGYLGLVDSTQAVALFEDATLESGEE